MAGRRLPPNPYALPHGFGTCVPADLLAKHTALSDMAGRRLPPNPYALPHGFGTYVPADLLTKHTGFGLRQNFYKFL
jgi:hypothetical protein